MPIEVLPTLTHVEVDDGFTGGRFFGFGGKTTYMGPRTFVHIGFEKPFKQASDFQYRTATHANIYPL